MDALGEPFRSETPNLSSTLAGFIAGADPVPAAVLSRTKDLILDTLGVAYAALPNAFARTVLTWS